MWWRHLFISICSADLYNKWNDALLSKPLCRESAWSFFQSVTVKWRTCFLQMSGTFCTHLWFILLLFTLPIDLSPLYHFLVSLVCSICHNHNFASFFLSLGGQWWVRLKGNTRMVRLGNGAFLKDEGYWKQYFQSKWENSESAYFLVMYVFSLFLVLLVGSVQLCVWCLVFCIERLLFCTTWKSGVI